MREWLRRHFGGPPAPATVPSVFEPYHYCAGGWFGCCEANLALQEVDPSYNAHFADLRVKYEHGYVPAAAADAACAAEGDDSAASPGRYTFTYRRWVWHQEVWFEELPRPSRLAPSACGLCYACVSHRGSLDCFFPRPDCAYARWHAARTAEWLGVPAREEKSCD